MHKVIVVESEKCPGCRICEQVCSGKKTGAINPSRARIHVVKWEGEGFYLPIVCQHCEDAACVAVCPKDALKRDEETHAVVHDYNLCIGCKMCVSACPFGAMGIDTVERKVIKCDLCEGDPTCVKFCDAEAIQYVDAATANLKKKREAGLRFSELMRRHA